MAKKAKRGVKPGTKRGRYRKPTRLVNEAAKLLKARLMADNTWKVSENQVGPAPILTLCGQLEDSIMLLETRISNAIAKINSLM